MPGTWTLQGYDKPHYTNVVMPFGNVPPSAPAAHNPTGLYRRPLRPARRLGEAAGRAPRGRGRELPRGLVQRERLGFSKDTRLPTEFDLTPFLGAGDNLLAFMVIRYSDASFIEDQDQWWYGGIYRSVYLYSTDFAYIADLDARPVALRGPALGKRWRPRSSSASPTIRRPRPAPRRRREPRRR